MSDRKNIIFDMSVSEAKYEFATDISSAINKSEIDLININQQCLESIDTLKKLTPDCDKLDYILATTSGVLCGVLDVFLVGKPGESPLGDITDKWFENRTKDFAKLCGWKDKDGKLSSAIKHLEEKFDVPYDQRGAGDAASEVFNLTPKDHHLKSLGHNPTLLGLFYSILDQFNNTSHFVSEGELISLEEADDGFVLVGKNIPSKLFCGFVNWVGHIISDASGSSSSKGRGTGIPSPLCSWFNDIVAIRRNFKIPSTKFDQDICKLALKMYKEGYDVRFQAAQCIPVFVNEMVVRLLYSIRRVVNYYINVPKDNHSFSDLWKCCEPFKNATVKRMLTVAHGTFCIVDIGDAVVRGFATGGGYFNAAEFLMRLNIPGVGRFSISLYGEVNRCFKSVEVKNDIRYFEREKEIIQNYIEGLKLLSSTYDDRELLLFVNDFENSDLYKSAFEKTVLLAEKRNVPEGKILRNKSDIDSYFMGGNNQ